MVPDKEVLNYRGDSELIHFFSVLYSIFETENCWEAKPNETINCAAQTMGMIEMLLSYLVSYLRSDETNAFLQKVSLLTK